jgi:hypothetical protein
VLIGAILFLSFLPCASLHRPLLNAYINGDWAHFPAHTAAAAVPLLAWRSRRAFALSLGVAVMLVGLQVLCGLISRQPTDLHGTVVNLLGIAAGILLGFNILKLRSRAKQ